MPTWDCRRDLMSQALTQTDGGDRQVADHPDLHQPDPHEDRRDVRQPRNDDRRQRAEVLFLRASSTSAESSRSRTGRTSPAAASGSRWSRTRWPRRSGRRSSTSCLPKAFPSPASSSISAWRSAWWRRPVPGTPTKGNDWDRVGKPSAIFSRPIRPLPGRSRARCANSPVCLPAGPTRRSEAKEAKDEKPERKVESRQDEKRGHSARVDDVGERHAGWTCAQTTTCGTAAGLSSRMAIRYLARDRADRMAQVERYVQGKGASRAQGYASSYANWSARGYLERSGLCRSDGRNLETVAAPDGA
jgi:hypothetical protein